MVISPSLFPLLSNIFTLPEDIPSVSSVVLSESESSSPPIVFGSDLYSETLTVLLADAPILSAVTGSVVKPFDVSPYWTAYIFFIIYQTAYQSENIRGALLSVDRGQLEAALAVGLSYYQAYKRIILPQAFAVAMPSFFTYYLHGIKSLALLFTIKIVDIFAAADIFAALYSRRTEPYVADAIIYWLLCVVLTFVFNSWERRLSKGLRPADN